MANSARRHDGWGEWVGIWPTDPERICPANAGECKAPCIVSLDACPYHYLESGPLPVGGKDWFRATPAEVARAAEVTAKVRKALATGEYFYRSGNVRRP